MQIRGFGIKLVQRTSNCFCDSFSSGQTTVPSSGRSNYGAAWLRKVSVLAIISMDTSL